MNEMTWEEVQAALKVLDPELQERVYYALQDQALLNSDEMLAALQAYHNGDVIDI
jgi:hypothetical protein